MGKYLKAVKISSETAFSYNQNYIISTIIDMFSVLIMLYLWKSIYQRNTSIGVYSLRSMIVYILSVQVINTFVDTSVLSYRISNDIRSGELSTYLLRPFSHFLYLFADLCGTKLTRIPIAVFGNCIIGFFFFTFSKLAGDVGFSFSITSVLLFSLFAVLSLAWNYVFDYLLGIVAFWVDNPWVIFYVKGHIIAVLSGLVIPIDLFPEWIRNIMKYLPFQYQVYFPYKVLIGAIAASDYFVNLYLFAFWIGIVGMITAIVWKRSIRRFTASGG